MVYMLKFWGLRIQASNFVRLSLGPALPIKPKQRFRSGRPRLRRREVPGSEVIEAGFRIPLFAGER